MKLSKLWLGFGGGAAAALPSGAVHRYDFSSDANLTLSGSQITGATDLGTGGNNLAPRTTGERPLNTGAINSVQAADFTGDSLFGNSLAGAFANTDQPYTVGLVGKLDTLASNQNFVTFNASASDNPYITPFQFNTTPVWRAIRRDTGATRKDVDAGTPDTDPHVFLIWSNGTTVSYSVDGVLTADAVDNDVGAMTGVNRLTLGVWFQNGALFNYLNGQIGEVVVYSSELSAGDRTALYNHLSNKWGF